MLRRLFVLLAAAALSFYALPSAAANTTLVVFPFSLTDSDDMGAALATQMAGEIAAAGGITIKPVAPGTKPAAYLSAARKAGADFYFTGSLSRVFNNYTGIEEIVSARNGILVWSAPIHFRALSDIAGEGRNVRNVIVQSQATPSPNAPGTVLMGTADSPTPSAAPINLPGGSGFAILPVAGSALESDRQYAVRAMQQTWNARGVRAVTVTGNNGAPIELAGDGPAVCMQTGARTVVQASLDTTHVASSAAPTQTTAHVSMLTYDCKTRSAAAKAIVVNHIAPVADDAIRGAVEDALSAFPSPS